MTPNFVAQKLMTTTTTTLAPPVCEQPENTGSVVFQENLPGVKESYYQGVNPKG
jgi:hypothetical protein